MRILFLINSRKTILCKSVGHNMLVRYYPHTALKMLQKSIAQNTLKTQVSTLVPLHYYIQDKASYGKLLRDYLLNKPFPTYYINSIGVAGQELQEVSESSIIHNVSGIWNAPQKFLSQDAFITEFLTKIVLNTLGGDVIMSSQDLADNILKALQPMSQIKNDYYYPALQHTLNSIFVLNRFGKEILEKITQNYIDYSQFKDTKITVQGVIEAHVIMEGLKDYISSNKDVINMKAQNPDSAEITQEDKNICYAQMKQPNADFRAGFVKKLSADDGDVKFYDVKLFAKPLTSLALSRGYISLTDSFTDKQKVDFMKRFIGDLKGSITQKKDNIEKEADSEKKSALKQKCDHAMTRALYLETIVKDKIISLAEKFTAFQKEQFAMNLDPQMYVVCSILVKIPDDTAFDISYGIIFKDKFANALLMEKFAEKKSKLFPENKQHVDTNAWNNIIKDIINHLPENLRQQIQENYDRIRLLEG